MKRILVNFSIIILIFVFSTTAFAEDSSYYKNSVESILDGIDADTKSILEDFGLSEYSYTELYNISFADIADLLLSIFKGSLKVPATCTATIIGMSVIGSIGSVYIRKSGSLSEYIEMITVVMISLFVLSEIIDCISRTVTAIESLGVFMKILIPIIAVLASVSGNPALAVSYNSVTVYAAEAITAVCRDFLTPILVIFTCMAVCLTVNSAIKSDSVLSMIKKCINTLLGLAGTVFTGIIAIKDVLSSGADKVSVKGIKFLLGTSVPVVGSALSEGLSSIIASVALMKSTFGIIGIIIIIVIALPCVCELVLWMLMLSFASYCCEIFSQNKTAYVISAMRFTVSMLLSILLFTAYILIVSTGMVLLISNR